MTISNLCPRCKTIPLDPVQVMNSLSRVDNDTYICSPCGTAEAMHNHQHPEYPLPPVDRPVYYPELNHWVQVGNGKAVWRVGLVAEGEVQLVSKDAIRYLKYADAAARIRQLH